MSLTLRCYNQDVSDEVLQQCCTFYQQQCTFNNSTDYYLEPNIVRRMLKWTGGKIYQLCADSGDIKAMLILLYYRVALGSDDDLEPLTVNYGNVTMAMVHRDMRHQGLLRQLITSMSQAEAQLGNTHCYYGGHQPVTNQSQHFDMFARCINLGAASAMGFEFFKSTGDRNADSINKLRLKVPTPSVLPVKLTPDQAEQTLALVCKNPSYHYQWWPTLEEWRRTIEFCSCWRLGDVVYVLHNYMLSKQKVKHPVAVLAFTTNIDADVIKAASWSARTDGVAVMFVPGIGTMTPALAINCQLFHNTEIFLHFWQSPAPAKSNHNLIVL